MSWYVPAHSLDRDVADRTKVVYLLSAIEFSKAHVDYMVRYPQCAKDLTRECRGLSIDTDYSQNAPAPAGRSGNACRQKINAIKNELRVEINAIKNGPPIREAKVKNAKGGKRKATDSDEQPKKRGRAKISDLHETVKDEEEIGKEV